MSSKSAAKNLVNKLEWLVIVYDKPNVNRLKFRPQHLEAIPPLISQGIVTNCGPIFKDNKRDTFIGSAFNIKADDESEILQILKNDIYAKEGIWDLDNIVVHPYAVHTRVAHNN